MKLSLNGKSILYSAIVLPASIFLFSCGGGAGSESAGDSASKPADTTQSMPAHNHDTAAAKTDTVPATVPLVKKAEVTIGSTYADTVVNGKATFETLDNGKVKMKLEIEVPAKAGKSVAVHIHEHADCGDNGKNTHGHWNPTNAQHGKWGSASFHSGDIGNVKLDAKGKGTLTLETDLWTLGGAPDKNIVGRAIIVHGGVDDYTTQPTGNAGSRIGCGIIK
ncbi:MAG: superoxide dismutase family protein [Agriterribacter sp.]